MNESVQTEKDIGRLIRNYDNKQNEGSRYSLLMTNYDFYDIYAILIAIRFKPQNECNAKIVQSVIDIISAPQNGNDVDSNIVRKKIREIYNLDRDLFKFAFVDNRYTYGIRFIKEGYPYSFLKNAFDKLLKCINDGDYNQVYALADALHNVPIFLSDGCKNLKKALRIEFSNYDKKYGTDLRKELLQRKFEE